MDAGGLTIDLTGRVAVVTGGSRGIGRATAEWLARAGARVVLSYRARAAEAEAVAATITAAGGQARAVAADVRDPAAVVALFDTAVAWGGGVDIVVANAGVWPAEPMPLASMPADQWRITLDTNLVGALQTAQEAARRLRPEGRLVLVSSTAAQRGEAFHADYAASKAALHGLAKSLAVELAPRGITVNVVAPGWVDTEMTADALAGEARRAIEASIPLGRVATAEDVAGPIVFLCSPLARHITGAVLSVNGGGVLCG
jgi:3-oxoacyl-[acyl-carrier protein] reductase